MGERPGKVYVESDIQPPNPLTVDWGSGTLHFKLYRGGEKISLAALPAGGRKAVGVNDSMKLTREQLGSLLWDVYGATRVSHMPQESRFALLPSFHLLSERDGEEEMVTTLLRPVASGGALYPCEVYVVAGEGVDLPGGCYHFDALHLGLTALNSPSGVDSGDVLHYLLRHLVSPGDSAADASPVCAFALSCLFWKDGYKYGAFSYRLQGSDIGAVIAQMQVIAARYGLDARIHWQFVDTAVAALLGLDPMVESIYAIVTLTRRDQATTPDVKPVVAALSTETTSTTIAETSAATPFITYTHLEPITYWPTCAAVHTASLYESPEMFKPQRTLPPISLPPSMERIPLPHAALDVTEGCANRRSSTCHFLPTPLTQTQLAQLLSSCTTGFTTDVDGMSATPQHTLVYCVVNAVQDIERGVYCYDTSQHALRQVRDGDTRDALQDVSGRSMYNVVAASLCLFLVGNYDAGFPIFGDRWYRMQNMEAGIIVQRAYLAASALGLGCRASLGYAVRQADELLCLSPGRTSLIQIIVGTERPSALSYEQHIDL